MTPSTAAAPHPADPVGGWPDRWAARLDEGLTRYGLTTGFQRDCAAAAVVAVVSVALAAAVLAVPGPVGGIAEVSPAAVTVVFVVLVAQALLLSVRRVHPVLCLLSVAALQLVLPLVLTGGDGVRLLAPLVAAYTCGTRLPGGRVARVVLVATLLESAGAATAGAVAADGSAGSGSVVLAVVGQALSSLLSYGGAAVIGAYVATRRRYVELLRARAAELVRAQRSRTDTAIRAERSRMARELHDIAAHHLSGMVVQTAVVERLIRRDPRAAEEAAAWVRRQGKETLRDLRLVVAALREPGDGATGGDDPDGLGDGGAPVPGLAALDRLVGTARDLGTPVDLVREGRPRELPPIADVSFYRVAQEALANAREHAPGAPVRIVLHHGEAATRLDVVNERAEDGGAAPDENRGFGLAGMQERAQMLGATFDAGPTASGGWRVTLTLPLEGRTAAGAPPVTVGPGEGTGR